MTFRRYLYKLFWKKIGVPLILSCAAVALVTTFYRPNKFSMVSAPLSKHFKDNSNKGGNDAGFVGATVSKSFYRHVQDEKHQTKLLEQLQKHVSKFPHPQRQEKPVKSKHDEANDEIEWDDGLFDLRKPHTHVQRSIVAMEEERPPVEGTSSNSKVKTMDAELGNHTDLSQREFNGSIYPNKSEGITPDSFREQNNSVDIQKLESTEFRNVSFKKQGVLNLFDRPQEEKSLGKLSPSEGKSPNADTGPDVIANTHEQDVFAKTELNQNSGTPKPSKGDTVLKTAEDELLDDIFESKMENEREDGVGIADYEDSFLPSDLTSIPVVKTRFKSKLYYDPKNPPDLFKTWSSTQNTQCNGKYTAYNYEFAYLKNVIVDRSKFTGRRGGEDLSEVLHQAEKDEYFMYDLGCFQLKCNKRLEYHFNNGHHLPEYLFNVQTSGVDTKDYKRKQVDFTIAVTRYEYANLYHTMTDWYNAFLLMNFFNKTEEETSVLLIDAHPKGSLDKTWNVLFKSVQRLSDLQSKTKYENMVWNILGYNSLLLQHNIDDVPLLEEFREFFLNSFNLNQYKSLECDKLNILFIWRRNYLAHPRNPLGIISRKIRNEKQLLHAVRRQYKGHRISGIQIDLFSMRQQLKLITEADVLIGMHGAGLTHAMFLPKHAGVIEFVPSYWSAMDHFLAIAKWRGLWYERWVNLDPHVEIPDQTTRIPPAVVITLLKSVLRKMQCIKPLEEIFEGI